MRCYVNPSERNCISLRVSLRWSVFLSSVNILVDLYITVYFPPSLCLCLPVSHVFLEPAGGKRGREGKGRGGPILTAILFPKCVQVGGQFATVFKSSLPRMFTLACITPTLVVSNQTHLEECVGSLSPLTAATIYHVCVCVCVGVMGGEGSSQQIIARGTIKRARAFKITTLFYIEITQLQDHYFV